MCVLGKYVPLSWDQGTAFPSMVMNGHALVVWAGSASRGQMAAVSNLLAFELLRKKLLPIMNAGYRFQFGRNP